MFLFRSFFHHFRTSVLSGGPMVSTSSVYICLCLLTIFLRGRSLDFYYILQSIIKNWCSHIFKENSLWSLLIKRGQKWRKQRVCLIFLCCPFVFLKIVQNEKLYSSLFSSSNLISGKILVLKLLPKVLSSNQIVGFFYA